MHDLRVTISTTTNNVVVTRCSLNNGSDDCASSTICSTLAEAAHAEIWRHAEPYSTLWSDYSCFDEILSAQLKDIFAHLLSSKEPPRQCELLINLANGEIWRKHE